MGAAYFYHLTRRPVEVVLPQLASRAVAQGWRVVVRGRERSMMEALDLALWTFDEAGFLPHGLAGGAHDDAQPILLRWDTAVPERAQCLMSVDGAEIDATEARSLERTCILFDGADPVALERARGQWRALTGAGLPAQYWSEASGKWEKKAEA